MIKTTRAYKTAIVNNTRTNVFQAQFEFVPPGAVDGAVVNADSGAPIGRAAQVNDGIEDMSAKWATLEHNRWVLDGSMTIPPAVDDVSEYGYWSAALSDEQGNFTEKPCVQYNMDADYDMIGVMLTFDRLGGEYPTRLTMQYLNSAGAILAARSFNINSVQCKLDLRYLAVRSVKIIFDKWCLPYRRAKMTHLLPGQIFTFDGNNTLSFDFSESITPFSSSFDSPEFEIQLDNSDREFDMLNPVGIFAYLNKKMKISSRLGTLLPDGETEWVGTGDYYLYNIPSDQQTETVKFVCRPMIALCENIKYPTTLKEQTTVENVVRLIFETAGITDGYTVDDTLKNINVNGYCGDDVKIVDAFAMIATAAAGYWKINRDGSYSLLPIKNIIQKLINEDTDVTLFYSNVFQKPAISSTKITSVKVSGNYFKTLTFDGYSDWTGFDTTLTAAVDDGNSVNISSAFISNPQRAQKVAEIALEFYRYVLNYTSDYRGNPAVEAGDIAMVETDYGYFSSVILENILKYDNKDFLSSQIKGRG